MEIDEVEEPRFGPCSADEQLGRRIPEGGLLERARRNVVLAHVEQAGVGAGEQRLEQDAGDDDHMQDRHAGLHAMEGHSHAKQHERRDQHHVADVFWLEVAEIAAARKIAKATMNVIMPYHGSICGR